MKNTMNFSVGDLVYWGYHKDVFAIITLKNGRVRIWNTRKGNIISFDAKAVSHMLVPVKPDKKCP